MGTTNPASKPEEYTARDYAILFGTNAAFLGGLGYAYPHYFARTQYRGVQPEELLNVLSRRRHRIQRMVDPEFSVGNINQIRARNTVMVKSPGGEIAHTARPARIPPQITRAGVDAIEEAMAMDSVQFAAHTDRMIAETEALLGSSEGRALGRAGAAERGLFRRAVRSAVGRL